MKLQERLARYCDTNEEVADLKAKDTQYDHKVEIAALRTISATVRERFYGNTTATQLREAVQMVIKSFAANPDYRCAELTKIVGKAK